MLVLTRLPGEWIIVGNDPKTAVAIQVVEVHGDKVRIGITADKDVDVRRIEVYDREHGRGEAQKLIDGIDSTKTRQT